MSAYALRLTVTIERTPRIIGYELRRHYNGRAWLTARNWRVAQRLQRRALREEGLDLVVVRLWSDGDEEAV